MANLVLNGKSIDCIDDIAENFVEEDVLREFRSGSLASWLEEYGYEEELERVRSIKPTASSIRVLAGISEALNLDDEVIADAASRREEQRRKEEIARKAREEHENSEEKTANNMMQGKDRKDDVTQGMEEKPSYLECINGVLDSSDIETAREAVRIVIKWYADKFIEDIQREDSNRINVSIFVWCALFGYNKCCSVLRKCCCVWLKKSPGMDNVRLRVGKAGVDWYGSLRHTNELYDGFVSDLKLDDKELARFWEVCHESLNLGQDKYMTPAEDYYVTEAIAKYFQW